MSEYIILRIRGDFQQREANNKSNKPESWFHV